jgi:hypothetical protein
LDNEIEPEELPILEDIKGEVETKQLKKDDKNA